MGMRSNGLMVYSILTLNETIGSSREDIWKAVRGACPVGYYKHFVVCLKKMRDDGQIAMRAGKFRLLMGFKLEMLMALENGKSGKKVATSSVSLKPGAKKTAAKKGKGAAKKAQIERKAAAVAVKGKAGKIASAKKGKAAAAKKGAKKTLNKKISAVNKAKNSRKGAAKTQKGKGAAGKPGKGGIQSKRK